MTPIESGASCRFYGQSSRLKFDKAKTVYTLLHPNRQQRNTILFMSIYEGVTMNLNTDHSQCYLAIKACHVTLISWSIN